VLYKSLVLMFVQFKTVNEYRVLFTSFNSVKTFLAESKLLLPTISKHYIVYYDLMTKQLICQYKNPSDFGQYHTCADCERILTIFEDCGLDRCVLCTALSI